MSQRFKFNYDTLYSKHRYLTPQFSINDNHLKFENLKFSCNKCGVLVKIHKGGVRNQRCQNCYPEKIIEQINIDTDFDSLRNYLNLHAFSKNFSRITSYITNSEKLIKDGKSQIIDQILYHTRDFPIETGLKERIYSILFHNGEKVKCSYEHCCSDAHFINSIKGYSNYCTFHNRSVGIAGRVDSQETKDKRANSNRGKFRSQETKDKMSHALKNSQALKEKMVEIRSRPDYREKISRAMKAKIADGSFTPCITNTWTHWDIDIDGKKLRSSFEAIFYIFHVLYNKNLNLQYEKLRIPYQYENNKRTYIVDFIDTISKQVYEIKPTHNLDKIELEKQAALLKWCDINKYQYHIITNIEIFDYFNVLQCNNYPHPFLLEFKNKYKL